MTPSDPAADAPRRGRRPRLTPRVVVTTGLRIVRDEGLAAVTMRRIADDLGTAPMSLYRHVADRQTLLVEMLDHVARGIPAPPTQDAPRAELAAVLTAIHDALGRDPWVVEVLVTDGLMGPSILPLAERAYAALDATGLDRRSARRVFTALMEFTYGEVLVTHHDRPDSFARRTSQAVDGDAYPHLAAIADAVRDGAGLSPVPDHYAEVVDAMLDALLPPSDP